MYLRKGSSNNYIVKQDTLNDSNIIFFRSLCNMTGLAENLQVIFSTKFPEILFNYINSDKIM